MAKRNSNEEPVQGSNPTPDAGRSSGGSMPAFLQAAMRLSSSRPLGAPRVDSEILRYRALESTDPTTDTLISDTSAVPGIAVIDYLPTLGISRDANSALNRASFNELNIIRQMISGKREYEPVDHMIYRLSTDSMHDLYDYIARAYTVLSTYNATNLYRPRYIMEAMGLDFDAWSEESANVYQWLLNHVDALEPFPTVEIGSISARHRAYNRCFYTDGDVPNAQTYIFNQCGFYSYEVVDKVKGISIRRPGVPGRRLARPSDFYELWDELYAALQSSSDVYTIAADIRRAMGDRVVTKCNPPELNENVQYLKLDAVLTSIMNASTVHTYLGVDPDVNYTAAAEAFRIYDGGNGILKTDGYLEEVVEYPIASRTVLPIIKTGGYLDHINTVATDPTPEDILHATRFKCVSTTTMSINFGKISSGENGYTIRVLTNFEDVGTEVVLGVRVYSLDWNGLLKVASPSTVELYPDDAAFAIIRTFAASTNFDWIIPRASGLISYDAQEDEVKISEVRTIEDTQNYVPLHKDVLSNIIRATLLAEFGITN